MSLPNCSNFSLLFHSRLSIKVTTSVYSSLSTDWASLCARLYKIKMRCRDSGIVWSPRDHDSFQSHPAAVVIMVDGGGLHPYQYCILILFLLFLICHIPLFLVVNCNSAFPLLCFLGFLLFFFFITLPPSDEQQPYSKVNLSPAAWLRVVSILFLLSLSIIHICHPFPCLYICSSSLQSCFLATGFCLCLIEKLCAVTVVSCVIFPFRAEDMTANHYLYMAWLDSAAWYNLTSGKTVKCLHLVSLPWFCLHLLLYIQLCLLHIGKIS